MNRYVSVFLLALRSTVYKIAGVLLLMAGAEGVLFWMQLQRTGGNKIVLLEEIIQSSGIPLVSGGAFLLVCVILSLVGCELSGSRVRYTIQRLSVREEAVVILWGVNSMLALYIFWAVQLGIVLLLSKLYIDIMEPVYFNSQTLFLAFHSSGFLHSLLPLEETSRLLRNVALIFSLGITASCFAQKQRRGQRGVAVVLLAALTIIFFSSDLGLLGSDITISVIALATAAFSLYSIFRVELYQE
ncbi:hypothetical protein FRZ06_13595 [Anoxybacterium hadale]|uniref:Uncharacterized protein n=1 Tax=Anoxybacterium hadale TaxID=3408580 RepID=A0ACD1ADM8_9FIRM|nr:hypothetical protein FRZ06_13595 [Clostridiales bacterium]